jgi:serine/threonine-protein kinase RsbW
VGKKLQKLSKRWGALAFAKELRVTLLAEPRTVKYIRDTVETFCRALSLRESEINDIKIAVSEACTNVVLHAYEHRCGRVKVIVQASTDKLLFHIKDEGRGFSRRIRARSSLASLIPRNGNLKPGGLGIHLMSNLVDKVCYHPLRKGTKVELIKHLH